MLIQCVPNFSEGRRSGVVQGIVDAVDAVPGVRLVDWSADIDHNRMVVTVVGDPASIATAVVDAAAVAVARIDLREHDGVHPRLGAIDVVPIVPLQGVTLEDCAHVAVGIARTVAERFALPVFLYEAASPDCRSLPDIRKRAFTDLLPDFGPSIPHPSAGAVVVGARGPLIAYNVVLNTSDPAPARTIARELRAGGASGLIGVRALGLTLPSRSLTQVSVNIVDPAATSIGAVFEYVCRRAGEFHTTVVESELIGAMPGFCAFEQIRRTLRAPRLRPEQVLLESWPSKP
ncbi:MAG: glutamate formimidoyltransferase [Capsulimonadaceae bacterium]